MKINAHFLLVKNTTKYLITGFLLTCMISLNLAFKFAGTSHVTWHTYHITFSTGQGWIAAGIKSHSTAQYSTVL
jgi:hypothetical protein